MFALSKETQHSYRRFCFACIHPIRFKQLQKKRLTVTADGYSFRPFVEHRCIFVHIPKCAGVSICRSLFGNLAGGHTTVGFYQIVFEPQEFKDYFKFAFVRNPWDRLVSAFLFLKQGGMNETDQAWAREHLSSFQDFDSFVRHGLRLREIREATHFRPQSDFICLGRNRPELDFIGFYENLEPDFSYICTRLNLVSSLLTDNKNKFRRKDYQAYYTEHTRRMVAEFYEDDLRILGYSFDNASLPGMLASRNSVG
jgi:Sulfotransferase family